MRARRLSSATLVEEGSFFFAAGASEAWKFQHSALLEKRSRAGASAKGLLFLTGVARARRLFLTGVKSET